MFAVPTRFVFPMLLMMLLLLGTVVLCDVHVVVLFAPTPLLSLVFSILAPSRGLTIRRRCLSVRPFPGRVKRHMNGFCKKRSITTRLFCQRALDGNLRVRLITGERPKHSDQVVVVSSESEAFAERCSGMLRVIHWATKTSRAGINIHVPQPVLITMNGCLFKSVIATTIWPLD